jgi:large subunit ribosomal protein L10
MVEKLNKAFNAATHAILVDFRGLNVEQTTRLRRQVGAESGRYEVVKNRLALLATADTPFQELADLFRGPTAVVSGSGDPVPVVRLLKNFTKDNPQLVLKGGLVEGQVLGEERLEQVANLPGREQLIARFAGSLVAPVARFGAALQSPLRDFMLVVKEIAKTRS